MWEILTGEVDREESIPRLSTSWGISRERLEKDLDAFTRDCLAQGLVERTPVESDALSALSSTRDAVSHKLAPKPRVALALYSMIATSLLLARRGFGETYLRCASLPRGDGSGNSERALAIFSKAENFFLSKRGQEDCLSRSLSLFRFLNRVNVAADHVIGVCRFPFRAHAWVEIGGQPALQGPVRDYTPLARL